MSKTDLTFLLVLVLVALNYLLDIGLISVIRDLLKRKDQ